MNPKALMLAGVTVGVAAVTAVILNLLAPIKHETGVVSTGPTVDEVFGGTLSMGSLSPIGDAEAVPAAQADAAPVVEAAAEPIAEPVEVAQNDSAVEEFPAAGEADEVSTPGVDVPSVAEEPAAPAETMAAESGEQPSAPIAGSCSTAVPSGGERVVVAAAGLSDGAEAPVDTAPAEAMQADTAPAGAAPAEEPAAFVMTAPDVMEPAAAAVAPPPAPKPAAKPRKPKVPDEVKKVWWPAKETGKLSLLYAGEASFTKAIALLFDGTFETPESANQNIVVKDKKGNVIGGTWFISPNKQMLLYKVDPGVYSVEIAAGLTDKGSRALNAPSSGPVYVP